MYCSSTFSELCPTEGRVLWFVLPVPTDLQTKIVSFSVISIVTRVRAGRSGVRIPAGVRDKTLLQDVRNFSATHKASSVSTGGGDKVTGGVSVTTCLHVMSWLRVSGAIPPLPLYALMSCVETALPSQTL